MTETKKAAQEQEMQMADAVAKVKAVIVRYENEIKKQIDLKKKNEIEIMKEEKKMTTTRSDYRGKKLERRNSTNKSSHPRPLQRTVKCNKT